MQGCGLSGEGVGCGKKDGVIWICSLQVTPGSRIIDESSDKSVGEVGGL